MEVTKEKLEEFDSYGNESAVLRRGLRIGLAICVLSGVLIAMLIGGVLLWLTV